jgi:YspA, cpYpsA-related SLOG family
MMFTYPINEQTWLICGGRDFADQEMFDRAMGDLLAMKGCPAKVVHGDARGADTMADAWGHRMAITVIAMPADWETYGNGAGPMRNQRMLDFKPALVIAFPGGKGTADMVSRARKAGIDVAEIKQVLPTPQLQSREVK